MNNRMSEAELAQVIAEIERLSQRRDVELDREQVQQILQELNLSPELLDEALVQIRRRQALKEETRRNRVRIAGVTIILVGAIATTFLYIQNQQQAIARIQAIQSRITITEDGRNFNTINRQASPRVYYYVTLQNAPIGQQLSLSCDWLTPNGQIVHQSRYSTRQIDKKVWSTYCYNHFDQSSAVGNWKVQMSVGDRPISNTPFVVK